jgi:oxygen-independent coproporphyrinogen-3 oxidase
LIDRNPAPARVPDDHAMSEAIIRIKPADQAPPSADVLGRIEGPGPRYTSYPTADRFDEAFGPSQLESVLAARRRASEDGLAGPLSIYIHIPFCESVCYYCACNKIVTKHHSRAGAYLDALDQEIDLVIEALGAQRSVSQLHLGGGSPTFLSDAEIARLMRSLRLAFYIDPDAELSIEVDPRTVTTDRLARLRAEGFNRISFGVQDFDAAVQQAVHRVQSYESVRDLIEGARALGFTSINADLIYGLPQQTPESFARTIAQVGTLRPDRIALYAYAHLPKRFKPQRRIAAAQLPDASERVAMLGNAMAGFIARGYVYIGMDHFALPSDSLAIAKREGRLHRNFQGYSTQPDCDLIGLGVSAIGRIGNSYYQNTKQLHDYYAALDANRFPVDKGLTPDADDLVRREIIMALMCHGRVEFADIDRRHRIVMRKTFADEIGHLTALVDDGFVVVDDDAIQVTPPGWYVVRAIAMVFDRHLRDKASRERFSRLV